MANEEIIELVLSKHPEISRKEILERLEKEKTKAGGLIREEVLLRMIASELGVRIPSKPFMPSLSIEQLVPGLNNVTIVGRVVALFPVRIIRRGGKVANLLISDKNQIMRVVLWNGKTTLVESGELKVGQMARFSHGYTRKGYSRNVEMHLGERSTIQIDPVDAKIEEYPSIHMFVTKIIDIPNTCNNKRVNVLGKVRKVFPISTFERKNLSSGKVMRFTLYDKTDEIPVVVWNEKVDELQNALEKGATLKILDAKTKKTSSRESELHIDIRTYVEKITPPTSL